MTHGQQPAERFAADLERPGRFVLVGDRLEPTCGRLPLLMPRRGKMWQLYGPGRPWLALNLLDLPFRACRLGPACRPECPLGERIMREPRLAGRRYTAALVWLSMARFPLVRDWERAVEAHGLRWPLRHLPREYKPPRPRTLVLVAHVRGVIRLVAGTDRTLPIQPAIVHVFRIKLIEYITGAPNDASQLRRARDMNLTVLPRPSALPKGVACDESPHDQGWP